MAQDGTTIGLDGWNRSCINVSPRPAFESSSGTRTNIPIEVTEKRHPVRVRQYAFHNEAGGAEKFRGAKGVVLDHEVLSEEAALTAIVGRSRFPSWGLDGGQEGSANRIEIRRRDGSVEHHGSVARLPLVRGDVARMITGTGGGKKGRGKEEDIRNGYITKDQASEIYRLAVLPVRRR